MGRTLLSKVDTLASGVDDDEVSAGMSRVKAGLSSLCGEVRVPYPLFHTYQIQLPRSPTVAGRVVKSKNRTR